MYDHIKQLIVNKVDLAKKFDKTYAEGEEVSSLVIKQAYIFLNYQ